MSVLCFIGAIVAAALGIWWLAAMTFIAGIMLAGIEAADRRSRDRFNEWRRSRQEAQRHP